MLQLRDLPIRRKLRVVLLSTCSAALVVACGALFVLQFLIFRSDFGRDLAATARVFAQAIAPAAAAGDATNAANLLASVEAKQNVIGGSLVLDDGRVLAAFGETPPVGAAKPVAGMHDDGGVLTCSSPVVVDGHRIGLLVLRGNYREPATGLFRIYAGLLVIVLTISFLVAVIISWRMERIILDPIENLADAAHQIAAKNDYSVRAQKRVDDEVGLFTDSFNLMLDRVQQREEALCHEIAERERAQQALAGALDELRRSEERFAKAFRASPIPSAIQSRGQERFVDVNDAFVVMTGFSREELLGHSPLELRLCIDYENRIRLPLDGDAPVRNVECQISTRDNHLRSALISIERIVLGGEPHLLTMVQDVSARLELEVQLRQAQKMESVGQLAAGIAHDFNNLLTVIQGHASLQLATGELNEDVSASMGQIALAADRAAELTRQLLAFSRRQVMRPRVLQLNEFVGDLSTMLQRAIGERIELRCELAGDLPPIWADQSSLEQIVMHLTLNARDAMPAGGCVTVATTSAQVTPEMAAQHPEARPGAFVRLQVNDTGVGMDAATRSRIFEPFFTTKEVNKGNGMGLATVYGITKQHDGWVEVVTAPGEGSTFTIYFPVTDRAAEPAFLPEKNPARSGLAHTILVVEDDGAVRELVKEILECHDYRVIEAENADAAFGIWDRHESEIELLLTDMVMPGSANGLELSQQLLARKPALKVIYTSGYSSDLFGSDVKLQEGVNYLPKPYLSNKLTAILANAFNGEHPGG